MDHELPNLSVHQLLYVREAARANTWTEAAERLGVSQSALSQGVAEVERRLGVTLFDRRGRLRKPTPELDAVFPVAEQVLAAIDDLDRRLAELATGTRGTLRIGMIDTAALGSLATPLARYRTEHPDVATTLVVEPSVPLAEKVASGVLDLAAVVVPNPVIAANPQRFNVQTLIEEPIYVYAPTPEEARTKTLHWGPWVSYPSGSQSRLLIETALAAKGATVNVVAESSNPDVLRQMVRLGVGWCALHRDVVEPPGQPPSGDRAGPKQRRTIAEPTDLARVAGPPLTYRTLALVRRTDALPNGAADALATLLLNTRPQSLTKKGPSRP
jgi:DNA-binding transcriptional LysR family regulator